MAAMTTERMPPKQTSTFLDELFPGYSQAEVGARIGRSRAIVNTWYRKGMPIEMIRPVVALALLDIEERRKELLAMLEEYSEIAPEAPSPTPRRPITKPTLVSPPEPEPEIEDDDYEDDDEIIIE